jgi:hypothetical protein
MFNVFVDPSLNKETLRHLLPRKFKLTDLDMDEYAVCLVNTLKKTPNPGMILKANQSKIVNRIINLTENFRNNRNMSSILDKYLVNTHWISNTLQLDKINRQCSLIIFTSRNKLYSVMIDGNDTINRYLTELITVAVPNNGGQNVIIAGNQFNDDAIGAFQIYRTYWNYSKDKYVLNHVSDIPIDSLNEKESQIIHHYFKYLDQDNFSLDSTENSITQTVGKFGFCEFLTIVPLISLDNRQLFTLPKGGLFGYVRDAYAEVLGKQFGFIRIDSNTGQFMPHPNIPYNLFIYKNNKKLIKSLDYAVMNASNIQSLQKVRDILNDKSLYFQALRFLSLRKNTQPIVPLDINDLIKARSDPSLYRQYMVPFTDDFNINAPDLKQKLSQYLKIKMLWLFKPSLGTQGIGIFVFNSSGNPDRDYPLLLRQLKTEIKNNTSTRDFSSWQISQFIDNPLLFKPFNKLNNKAEQIIGNGGRKSHLRFYMIIVDHKTDSHRKLDYYMLPESCVFLAVLPYSRCQTLLKKGNNAMNYRETYLNPENKKVKDPNPEMNYCNQSNLTLGGIYFKTRGLVGNSYGIFASNAETAFNDWASENGQGKDYYRQHVLPQLQQIAKYTTQCVRACHLEKDALKCNLEYVNDNLCKNKENCFQFIAIDVMFDDGRYSNGIPQPFILEANMTPGLRGPSSVLGPELFKEMITEIITHGIGLKPNISVKLQIHDSKKIEEEE